LGPSRVEVDRHQRATIEPAGDVLEVSDIGRIPATHLSAGADGLASRSLLQCGNTVAIEVAEDVLVEGGAHAQGLDRRPRQFHAGGLVEQAAGTGVQLDVAELTPLAAHRLAHDVHDAADHRGATRFWHGFYNQKAVCHYTGAALAVVVESSSRQEYDIYPELYEQLEQTLGGHPESVIADKGFSVGKVFQHNTERGVATVISYKRAGGDRRRHDKQTHDRHGVPRCKHCGGPSNFVRFNENPKPRVWFDCAVVLTSACKKTQSMMCEKDWRLLVPLWRTNPLYHELKHSHGHYEHTHNNWRSRYRVAADDLGIRPKRRGAGWQRLRAACGLIAEWLRICHRQGWLGSARINRKHKVERPADWQKAGEEAAASLAEFRRDVGITAPYGKTAHALDPAWPEKTPSQIFKAKQEQEAAEKQAAAQAAAAKTEGKRRRRKSDPPPPKKRRPRPPEPPPAAKPDGDDLPF
jgi:hypothetical protein